MKLSEMNKRKSRVIGWLLLLTFAAALASVGMGDMQVRPDRMLRGLFGAGDPYEVLVVQNLRLPRLIIGMLVGASLAVSGAALQGVVRNPLAAPDIIGVTGGASAAAVLFVVYAPPTVSVHWLPAAAMAGAVLVSILIYLLAWNRGVTPLRLILVGIGVASLLSAFTTLLIIFSPMHTAAQAYVWLTGSIYGSSWQHVVTLLPWTLVFLLLIGLFVRQLNVQALGDDIAAGLGSHVQRHRLLLILFSVALAGSAVSMGGAIGFVGLIAPHMARRLVGPAYAFLLPTSALLGGIIVIIADLVARTLFLPLDIPVGVFTSAIGAPFFIYLLYRTRNHY